MFYFLCKDAICNKTYSLMLNLFHIMHWTKTKNGKFVIFPGSSFGCPEELIPVKDKNEKACMYAANIRLKELFILNCCAIWENLRSKITHELVCFQHYQTVYKIKFAYNFIFLKLYIIHIFFILLDQVMLVWLFTETLGIFKNNFWFIIHDQSWQYKLRPKWVPSCFGGIIQHYCIHTSWNLKAVIMFGTNIHCWWITIGLLWPENYSTVHEMSIVWFFTAEHFQDLKINILFGWRT